MTTSHRRITLLTGASLAALGAAVPAYAAVEPSTPVNNTGPSVTDSENICVDLSPDSDCLFGVSNTGSGLVTSQVINPATGQLQYTNVATTPITGDVDATLTNDAVATISAFASATGL